MKVHEAIKIAKEERNRYDKKTTGYKTINLLLDYIDEIESRFIYQYRDLPKTRRQLRREFNKHND